MTATAGSEGHRVVPDEVDPPTSKEARGGFWEESGCVGSVALVLWLFVGGPFAVDVLDTHPERTVLFFAVSVIVFAVGTGVAYVRGIDRRRVEIHESRVRASAHEAERLSKDAGQALVSSNALAVELRQALACATAYLEKADRDFRERAFGPFWDAIEKAAHNLEFFRAGVNQVARNAQTYYAALEGRCHTFPSFSPRPELLDDPAPVLAELHRLVRKGQTDFEFANIWEHRRTREVLIAGFRTLEDGITNLGVALTESLSDLQNAMSTQLANMVEQQIATHDTVKHIREEHGRALASIERRRKPFP